MGSFEELEGKTLDWRFRFKAAAPPEQNIALVLIGDNCLQELGGWPFSRGWYGKAIDILASAGASAVGFDLILDEPSTTDTKGDVELIAACNNFGKVVFPLVFLQEKEIDRRTLETHFFEEIRKPFPPLASAPISLGFINADFQILNPDGVYRKTFIHHSLQGTTFPAFSLALFQTSRNGKKDIDPGNIFPMPPLQEISGAWNQSNSEGIIVNYEPHSQPFPTYSFGDLVKRRLDPGLFRGKTVLVGPSALGLGDIKVTPIGLKEGVFIHATVLCNLLSNQFVVQISHFWYFFLLLGVSIFSYQVLVHVKAFFLSSGIFILGIFCYVLMVFAAFRFFLVLVPLLAPVSLAILTYVSGRFFRFYANLKQANIALLAQNLQLEKTNAYLDAKLNEITTLNEAGSRFPAILNLEILAQEVLNECSALRGATKALLLCFEEGDHNQYLGRIGVPDFQEKEFISHPDVVSNLAQLLDQKKPICCPTGEFSSYLPLLVGNRSWGAILLKEPDPATARRWGENFWSTLLGIIATALENARLYETAQEVDLAREVQKNLLPSEVLSLGEYRVFGKSRPASRLGGDYFDYFTFGGGKFLLLLIADVMGHGVPAALGMTIVKTAVMQFPKENLITENLIASINSALRQSSTKKLMVTAAFFVVNTETHETTFFHCGHVYPIKKNLSGSTTTISGFQAVPLGCGGKVSVPSKVVSLDQGERIFLFTDGLIETIPAPEESDGYREFQDFLEKRPTLPIEETCNDILNQHPHTQTGKPQPDDFTILILERWAGERGNGKLQEQK